MPLRIGCLCSKVLGLSVAAWFGFVRLTRGDDRGIPGPREVPRRHRCGAGERVCLVGLVERVKGHQRSFATNGP